MDGWSSTGIDGANAPPRLASTASASSSTRQDQRSHLSEHSTSTGDANVVAAKSAEGHERANDRGAVRASDTSRPDIEAQAARADAEAEADPLPRKRRHPILRNVRHRLMTVYHRLFTLVFLANLGAVIWYCAARSAAATLDSLAALSLAVAVNLFVTALFRTDDVVNVLYATVLWVPHSLPLLVRRRLAKVYEFGGVHSGAGSATAAWAVLFTVQVTRSRAQQVPGVDVAAVVLTYLLIGLLLMIIVAAHPSIRRRQHNCFEAFHRFCGWGALVLFWCLALVLTRGISHTRQQTFAYSLFTAPTVYFLFAITYLTVLPWLRLRKLQAHAVQLSPHATRIYFSRPTRVGPAVGVRISTSPLFEWHSFATIPCSASSPTPHLEAVPPTTPPSTQAKLFPAPAPPSPPSKDHAAVAVEMASSSTLRDEYEKQVAPPATTDPPRYAYSILVSRAGDWTTHAISGDPSAHRTYYQRGIPVAGIALVVRLFRRAVVLTTGSGIGPALSLMAAAAAATSSPGGRRTTACRLVWSTPAPLQTYGAAALADVRRADPDALVWDTKIRGRPDMLRLAWEQYRRFGAEAVVVVSNPTLTHLVVYGLEARGVPAFGPIFDS